MTHTTRLSECVQWKMSHIISHVLYMWVMSYIYESCLVWRSHVSYIWVMSHMKEFCLIYMSQVSYISVMSHIYDHEDATQSYASVDASCESYRASHVSRMIHMCAMTHSHVTCQSRMIHTTHSLRGRVNDIVWVMSRVWFSRVAFTHVNQINESYHMVTYVAVSLRCGKHTGMQWMSHGTCLPMSRMV